MSDAKRGRVIRALGRGVRDGWLMLGLSLVLVLALNAVLKEVIPRFSGETVVAGADSPRVKNADTFDGKPWADAYHGDFKSARQVRWEPYVYWRRQPHESGLVNVDRGGLRRTYNPPPTDHDLSIWVLGGSTTWGSGSRDDFTIPSLLSKGLESRGIPAQVTNLGETGYVGTQELIFLMRQLQQGRRPDLVIFYDGVNDVFSALQAGRPGIPQNEQRRRREFQTSSKFERWALVSLRRLEGFTRLTARVRGSGAADAATGATAVVDDLAGQVVGSYLEIVRMASGLGQVYGFETLHFWQPAIFTKRVLSSFEQRIVDGSLRAHRELHLQVNGRVAASADLQGAPSFHDLTALLDDLAEPIYLDFCHTSERANGIVAEAMLEEVVNAAGVAAVLRPSIPARAP